MALKETAGRPILCTTNFFHLIGLLSLINRLANKGTSYFFTKESLEDTKEPWEAKVLNAVDTLKPRDLVMGSHQVLSLCYLNKSDAKGLDLGSVVAVAPAGAPVPPNTVERLAPIFPNIVGVANGYSLTEFGGVITVSFDPAKLGVVLPGKQVKIVNPKNEEILGQNQVGEIYAKSKLIMKGYLNNPQENTQFFASDGFIRTGDFGHFDNKGLLYFDGRSKDLIKYKNFHVYPKELVDVLIGHPAVKDGAIFGVLSRECQELVTGVAILHPGANVTGKNLADYVNDKIGEDFKRIRGGVYIVDSIPRDVNGKTLNKDLKPIYTRFEDFI